MSAQAADTCLACNGEGVIHTGIDEAPVTECSRCDGTGYPPLPAAPAPTKQEEEDGESAWRRLALQFDGHRMQAIGHIHMLLADQDKHASVAAEFLKAGPLSGEAVLAQRIAALASQPVAALPAEQVLTELPPLTRYDNIVVDGELMSMRPVADGGFYKVEDVRAALAARQVPTEAAELSQHQKETLTALRMWSEAGRCDLKLSLEQDKDGVQALFAGFDAARQVVAPDGAKTDLHAAIMNIRRRCNTEYSDTFKAGYSTGHRDARHDAAELVSARPVVDGAVERDAARYRWLRDKSEPGICAFYLSVGKAFDGVKFTQATVDEAIDAQIAQEKAS